MLPYSKLKTLPLNTGARVMTPQFWDRPPMPKLGCYRSAYFMTFVSGLFGIAVCLWAIVRERNINNKLKTLPLNTGARVMTPQFWDRPPMPKV
jgi:hypothetical protein